LSKRVALQVQYSHERETKEHQKRHGFKAGGHQSASKGCRRPFGRSDGHPPAAGHHHQQLAAVAALSFGLAKHIHIDLHGQDREAAAPVVSSEVIWK